MADNGDDILINIDASTDKAAARFRELSKAVFDTSAKLGSVQTKSRQLVTNLSNMSRKLGLTKDSAKQLKDTLKQFTGSNKAFEEATMSAMKLDNYVGKADTNANRMLRTLYSMNTAFRVAATGSSQLMKNEEATLRALQSTLAPLNRMKTEFAEAAFKEFAMQHGLQLLNGDLVVTQTHMREIVRLAKEQATLAAKKGALKGHDTGELAKEKAGIESVTQSQNCLSDAVGRFARVGQTAFGAFKSGLSKAGEGVTALVAKVAAATPVLGRFVQKTGESGDSFFQMRAKIFMAISAIAMFGVLCRSIFDAMSSQIETTHKMTVAFSELTDATGNFIDTTDEWGVVLVRTTNPALASTNGYLLENNEALRLGAETSREYAAATKEVATYTGTLRDYLGFLADGWQINRVNVEETAATFKSMLNAMGESVSKTGSYADTLDTMTTRMSVNMTSLAYDMASLWDVDVATASQKFQSALAGQTRAVRSFGIDVTEASLVAEAAMEGFAIDGIKDLQNFEKAILIHNSVVRQALAADGDWAESIETPANRMRVLKEQLLNLAQNIGALLIPMIQALLPILTALTKAMIAATEAIARFFGMDLQKQRDQFAEMSAAGEGVGSDMNDAFGDASDSVRKTTKEVKELKRQLMGFDVINNITKPSDSSNKPNNGNGTSNDLGLGLLDYLPSVSDYKSAADRILDGLKAALEEGGWERVGQVIGAGVRDALASVDWDSAVAQGGQFGEDFALFLNGIFSTAALPETIGKTLGESINTAIAFAFKFTGTFDWSQFGTFVGTGLNTALTTVNWDDLAMTLTRYVNGIFTAWDSGLDQIEFGSIGYRITNAVTTALQGIDWATAQQAAAKAFGGMATMLNGAMADADLAGTFGQTISGAVNMALSGAYSFVTTFNFAKFGTTIGSGLANAVKGIDWDKWNGTLESGLKGVFTAVDNFFATVNLTELGSNIGKSIATAIGAVDFKQIGGWASNVLNSITAGLAAIATNVDMAEFGRNLIDGIVNFFANIDFGNLGQMVAGIVNFISGAFNKAVETIFSFEFWFGIFGGIVEFLGGFFGKLDFGEVAMAVINGIFLAESGLLGIFKNLGKFVGNLGETIFNGIKGLFTGEFKLTDLGIVNSIVTRFTSLWDDILAAGALFLENPVQFLKTVFGDLFSKAEDIPILGSLIKMFKGFGDNFTTTAGKLFSDPLGTIVGVFKGLAVAADDIPIIGDIVDAFSKLWDGVTGFFADPLGTIQRAFTNMAIAASDIPIIGDIQRAFGKLWDGVGGFFSDPIGTIKSALANMAIAAKDIPIIGDITRAFSNWWNDVTGFFKNPVGTVKNALKGTIDAAKDIPIIGNIVSGFSNMWGNITKDVKSFWNDPEGTITKKLDGLANATKDIPIVGNIVSGFKGVWDKVKASGFFKDPVGTITGKLDGLANATKDIPILGNIVSGFSNMWNDVVKSGFFKDPLGTITSKLGALKDATKDIPIIGSLVKAFSGIWDGITGFLKDPGGFIIDALLNAWDGIANAINGFIDGFNKISPIDIPLKLPTKDELKKDIDKTTSESNPDPAKVPLGSGTTPSGWAGIANGITSGASLAQRNANVGVGTTKDQWKTTANGVTSSTLTGRNTTVGVSTSKSSWKTTANSITNSTLTGRNTTVGVSTSSKSWKSAANKITNVSLTTRKVGIKAKNGYNGKSFFKGVKDWVAGQFNKKSVVIQATAKITKVQAGSKQVQAMFKPYGKALYASGGMPNMGQVFIAREAGPEMVGTIGNRNAVANNDQIVAAVSQGVANAVRSVMASGARSSGGSTTVSIQISGREIIRAINREQSEAGRNLLTI